MSVVSLARTARVTALASRTSSRASRSPFEAEVSTMSTTPARTSSTIARRYSGRVRKPPPSPGAGPAAWTPNAMSASLASASTKCSGVYEPAAIAASLRSSAFMVATLGIQAAGPPLLGVAWYHPPVSRLPPPSPSGLSGRDD